MIGALKVHVLDGNGRCFVHPEVDCPGAIVPRHQELDDHDHEKASRLMFVAYLEHSCDEWRIGGENQARDLIRQLEDLIHSGALLTDHDPRAEKP